jgi:hypothetical protein
VGHLKHVLAGAATILAIVGMSSPITASASEKFDTGAVNAPNVQILAPFGSCNEFHWQRKEHRHGAYLRIQR